MPKLDVLSPGSLDFHRVFTVIRGFLVSAFLASRLLSSLDLLCLCCGGGGLGEACQCGLLVVFLFCSVQGGEVGDGRGLMTSMPMKLTCSVSASLRAGVGRGWRHGGGGRGGGGGENAHANAASV